MCLSIFKSNKFTYCTIASLCKGNCKFKIHKCFWETLASQQKRMNMIYKTKIVWMKIEWMNEWNGRDRSRAYVCDLIIFFPPQSYHK